MIYYTPMVELAMKVCFDAHKDQADKRGVPYVFHPMHVAETVNCPAPFGKQIETYQIVALLHDVVEDSHYTLSDLHTLGFSDEVIEAVSLLTHDKSVPYFDYIKNLQENRVARLVKIADICHNCDPAREIDDSETLNKRYAKALTMLRRREAADSARGNRCNALLLDEFRLELHDVPESQIEYMPGPRKYMKGD